MTADEEEAFNGRYDRNLSEGRGLAERLAQQADTIASTLSHLAAVHEGMASSDHHPFKAEAMERAVAERRMAERERQAAVWLRSVASGSNRSRPAAAPAGLGQRVPSQ